ncbi:hypothetical protein PTTG_11768 [Puccinia triticina 1-1 BBBD Race 1]|uniref:Uncharacterized protein n=1 Tax=Puccinia triticina (isolate 1-1 / race 1 (BBBD)) TaxID=630390 RepID=A0A180GKU2_PUCT1|nr:hypothetical protein PTTG_11768 [Puccinia triticina 1-1 BBBD Race 1]WAR60825.1 hypothetical protein PtB15_13B71 [Puccinia triticina]
MTKDEATGRTGCLSVAENHGRGVDDDEHGVVEGPCTKIHRLDQFFCQPDTLRGSRISPKWTCAAIHRFFKLRPSPRDPEHPSRLISVEIQAPPIEIQKPEKAFDYLRV